MAMALASITEVFDSARGLIPPSVAFLTGLWKLLPVIQDIREIIKSTPKPIKTIKLKLSSYWSAIRTVQAKHRLILPLVLFLLAALFFAHLQPAPSVPDKLCISAWNAYNDGEFNGNKAVSDADFEQALTLARRVTSQFSQQALNIQTNLQANSPEPPVSGRVISTWAACWRAFSPHDPDIITSAQRDIIFKQGLVNTVATCYCIQGLSLQELHRTEEAKEAFRETLNYPYGRNWEPSSSLWSFLFPGSGIFWSPASKAKDQFQMFAAKDKDAAYSH